MSIITLSQNEQINKQHWDAFFLDTDENSDIEKFDSKYVAPDETKLSKTLHSFLSDVIGIDLHHYGQQQQPAVRHNEDINFLDPRSTIEYYIIQKFTHEFPDTPVRLRFKCSYNDLFGEDDCVINTDRHNDIPKIVLLEAKKNIHMSCFPFIITISWNKSSHRICGYFFVQEWAIVLFDSSQVLSSDEKDTILDATLDFWSHTFLIHKSKCSVEFNDDYFPQNTECLSGSNALIFKEFITDAGTCAIWARFMYTIGCILHTQLHYKDLTMVIKYLKDIVFPVPSLSLKFQIYILNLLPLEFKKKYEIDIQRQSARIRKRKASEISNNRTSSHYTDKTL